MAGENGAVFRAVSSLIGEERASRLKDRVLFQYPVAWTFFLDAAARQALRLDVSKHSIDLVDSKHRRRLRISREHHALIGQLMVEFDHYFSSVEPLRVRIDRAEFDLVDFSTPRYHDIRGFPDFPVFCPTMAEPYLTAQQYREAIDLKAGDVVIDLGAYCGLTTICFSKAVGPAGRVISVEPDPVNFATVSKNVDRHIKLSGLDNIALVQAAATARPGKVPFSAEGTMDSSASEILGSRRGRTIEVAGVTLSDLAGPLQRVDAVKMDIQGGELSLVEGSGDFFKRFRPGVVIETHVVDGVQVSSRVIEALVSYGYDCQSVEQVGSSLPLVVGRPRL